MKKKLLMVVKMMAFYSFTGLLCQIILFNIIFAVPTASAQDLKDIRIDLSISNASIDQALQIIGQKTNFKFNYIKDELPLQDKVNINVISETLYNVLVFLAKNHSLTFNRINDQIVVKKLEEKDPPELVSSDGVGTIKGKITDLKSKEPLPFASVVIKGTSLGVYSDKEGNFVLQNIHSGNITLHASYIGYVAQEVNVEVKDGKTTEANIKLTSEGVLLNTVEVTAQAGGQMAAINEQLSSISLINSVSADRIKELPDANAAESVGRLPGVSLLREGGEGSKVVIRGLSPQYNQVTIDGVQLSGNVGSNSMDKQSTDIGDRATNLSMISSSMLGGIEVTKAITPDMDAAVLGGVVNFDLRKAQKSDSDLPKTEIMGQGGYNDLRNSFRDYKFGITSEKRFFDDSFGVFIQGTAEQRNLSSNEFGASYTSTKESPDVSNPVSITSLNLSDITRIRKRLGATLVLDYKLPNGEIDFMNFVSSSDTKSQLRGETFDIAGNIHNYSGSSTHNELNVITNIIDIKQTISIFNLDAKFSHTYSESRNPMDMNYSFRETRAGLNTRDLSKLDPRNIPSYALNDFTNTYLDGISTDSTFSRDRALTASLNINTHFNFSNLVTADLKFGGMYQYRTRSYDYEEGDGELYYGSGLTRYIQTTFPQLKVNGDYSYYLPIYLFKDPNYSYGNFLKGDYHMGLPVDQSLMWQVIDLIKRYGHGTSISNDYANTTNDYSGNEKKSAAYVMATIKIGQDITILPGIRYQNLETSYSAPRGTQTSSSRQYYQHSDTTIDQSHGYWLPMIHLKYKPASWAQIQFAYTNTLNYPDYNTITPRIDVGFSSISYNNYRLKPARSENYDLAFSLFSNEIGLLTIDGFNKNIKDLVFSATRFIQDPADYPGIDPNTRSLVQINTNINNPYTINLYGVEVDWQTNFWYLPAPFSGLVLNVNFTHIFSEAKYPRSVTNVEYLDGPPFVRTTVVDTFYTSRLLNQPKDILNIALGYDYKDFSIRISMLYQDNIFKNPDFWQELRVNSDKYTRWDLSIKQTLPWYGLQLFLDVNNIFGARDVDLNQGNSFPASEQHYGMTADFGVRWRL